jgi:hypothetical protein
VRFLWLFWLPLLFLPNLGQGGATGFGTLELSDFLIVPYLILVYAASRSANSTGWSFAGQLVPLLIAFVAWATLSTITISVRYDGVPNRQLLFGLLKLGKLVLYGLSGILTSKALEGDSRVRDAFHYALLAAGCVVAISLLTLGSGQSRDTGPVARGQSRAALQKLDLVEKQKKDSTYKATNAISAMMAVIICYLVGVSLARAVPQPWGRLARFGLVVMSIGFFLSDGRGGWLAACCGIAYLYYKRGMSRTTIASLLGIVIVSTVAYSYLPTFRKQVDNTLFPDESYRKTMVEYGSGVGGVDDGARLNTWAHEGAKFLDSPLLGAGFFHRGRVSGLWGSGSHNFFLQMFLETGAPGGLLILAIVVRMWRQAGTDASTLSGFGLPLRSGLVAAFLGGLGGEYYYGGIVLLGTLLVYAPIGALSDAPPLPHPTRHVPPVFEV